MTSKYNDFSQLTLGFENALLDRENILTRKSLTCKQTDRFKKQLRLLYESKDLLNLNELNWCSVFANFYEKNGYVSRRQAEVVHNIFIQKTSWLRDF